TLMFIVMLLMSNTALTDGGLCYILDGILVIYGIILTVLYCRRIIESCVLREEETLKCAQQGFCRTSVGKH
uniref:Uncharacterized protein n=1 Tax=Pygocentrus nattereri TaxID=42514 RepID=A0AAR2LVL4_PYGNA